MPNATAKVSELVTRSMEADLNAPFVVETNRVGVSVRRVLKWLVYAGTFFIPILFLPFTTDVLDFNKGVLLFVISGVGLVLYLVDMIKEGTLRYRSNSFYWPMLGFVVAGIISVVASVSRYSSMFGLGNAHAMSLVSLISLGLFLFLATHVADDRGVALKNLLVSSVSLAIFVGALQMMGLHIFSGPVFGKPNFNTVGSLNALGFLAAAMLPLLLVSSETEVKWQRIVVQILRALGFASAILILIVLNWSYLWIVAFVGILSYIAFTSSTEYARGKMQFYALPMAIIVLGAFLWVINFKWTAVTSKFPVEVSPTHTISYNIAGDSLRNRPLGYGLENYVVGYDKLRPEEAVNNLLFQARFVDGTSEFATMIVEGGIPMILAFLAFLFVFARALYLQILNKFDGDANNGKLWASAISMVLVFFFYPMTTTFFFTLIVLLSITSLRNARTLDERVVNLEDKSMYSLVGSVVFVVGLVAVLVGGYFAVNQYISNIQIANALEEPDRSQSINIMVRAVNSYVHDTRTYRLLSQTLLQQIADDLKNGPKAGVSQSDFNALLQNRIASTINVAVRATEVDPSDSENWMNRGYVYQNLIPLVSGSDEAAISMYHEALSRSPANALAHVRIGNIHLSLSDDARKNNNRDAVDSHLKAAEEEYKKAIDLYNNYGQALYNLAAVYDRMGELPQAIKQFERLQATNPRDPSILFQLGLLYYRNNQKDNALRSWEQAVLSFPNYSNARWYLSLIYEERNDLKRALAEVQAIAKVNPDNALVEERIAKLTDGIRQIVPPDDVLDQTPLNNEQ